MDDDVCAEGIASGGALPALSPRADRKEHARRGGLDVVETRSGRHGLAAVRRGPGTARAAVDPGTRPAAESRCQTARRTCVILVVDDEQVIREFVRMLLARAGYTVLVAPDGLDALAIVRRQAIDLVITDLSMPRLGGGEFIARLRARKPSLPVLVMSGSTAAPGLERITADPAADFLQKPFSLEELQTRVEVLLSRPRPIV